MNATTNGCGEAAFNTLFDAGREGVSSWTAAEMIDALLDDPTDPIAYDRLMEAHLAGGRERARAAVARAILAHADSPDPFVDPADAAPIEGVDLREYYDVAQIDLAQVSAVELHEYDAEYLIERAAEAAEIPPEDIVAIVAEFCPTPQNALFLAQLALRDYRRIPFSRKQPPEASPAPAPEPRPEPPAAFDLAHEPGLLGDTARWSVQYAFRPVLEFAAFSALATLAPIYGRRFVTPTNAGLNLYLIALAQTGTGKEALLGAPVAALSAAKLDFLIGAGDFSSDSAIELALRMRPNFLAPIDEIGEFIGAAQHRNAAAYSRTIRKSLLELFSKSRPDARWTGKQKVEVDRADKASEPIYSPHLSILGCATVDGFFAALTEANLSDGLINRFVVVQGGRPGAHNLDPARSIVPAELAKRLADAYAMTSGGNLEPSKAREASARPNMRVVPWGDGGEAAWLEILHWQIAAEDEGRGGIVSRAAENCLKIATIRALSLHGLEAAVTAADVAFGWSMVRASIDVVEAGARDNMAGSDFEQLVKLMERAVVDAGPDGIAWSKLLERRGIAKHTKSMVDGARERLEDRGVIYRAIGTGPNGGRPGMRVTARRFFE